MNTNQQSFQWILSRWSRLHTLLLGLALLIGPGMGLARAQPAYTANCTLSFSQPTGSPIGVGRAPGYIAIGDFNLDRIPDLAVTSLTADNVTVLLGDGNGGFTQPANSPISTGHGPFAVVVGDVNLDHLPDLVVANISSNDVTLLLGDGQGGFTQAPGSPVNVGNGPTGVGLADFNFDGKPDLAVANAFSDNVTLLLGDGNGGFRQPLDSPVSVGDNPHAIAIRDFNLDDKLDLAVANFLDGNVMILLGDGSGGFRQQLAPPLETGAGAQYIAVGDFNSDDKADLAAANINADTVTILLGNDQGSFSATNVGVGGGPLALAVDDFDLDGKADLAVANFTTDNVTLLRGDGSGVFSEPPASPVNADDGAQFVAAGDFNRDGNPDLAVANFNADNVTILLNNCPLPDSTPPTANPIQVPAANPAGWNTGNVTVDWQWSDNAGGSGLDLFNCTAGNTVSGAGRFPLTASCKDQAGNIGSATYLVQLDNSPPSLNPTMSPNPVPVGGAATVVSGAVDPLSGVASERCDAPDVSTVGIGIVTCTARDNAGNTASATITYTVTNPTVTSFSCSNATGISQPECAALVMLYNSTNGVQWSNIDWLSNNTPCYWSGLFCSDGSVLYINLNTNGLRGTLPAELSHLTNLLRLDLGNNQLSGALPPQLGALAHLQELYLNNNHLSGTIPSQLSALPNLLRLDLSNNQLSGTIPPQLGNLANLEVLDLNANRLSGPLPVELSHLTNLQYLRLNSNQLSGTIPPQFGNLANLEVLDLALNQLGGTLPAELGNLAKLRGLSLAGNRLSGSLPPQLGNLTNLQFLVVGYNQVHGHIPATLCTLPLQSGADFSYNQLATADPCFTAQYPNWLQTQTAPPTHVQAQTLPNQQVQVTWTPITYTADGGYYLVLIAPTAGGPYTAISQTTDKTATGLTLPSLGAGAHYLVVRTFTPKHDYQQNDLISDDSNEVVVVLSNTPPVAVSATLTTAQGRALPVYLSASDLDPDSLNYVLIGLPTHGAFSGTAPNLVYTPAPGFTGSDSFTFKANDGQADSNLATITIQVVAQALVNTAPVVHSQTITTTQNMATRITLTAADDQGDRLSYQVLSQPSHGLLVGVAPTLVYTPTTDYSGADSFTFQVSDGQLISTVATVQIHVTTQPNRPPTTQDDTFTVTRDSQANVLAVLTNDRDADADGLTLIAVSPPSTARRRLSMDTCFTHQPPHLWGWTALPTPSVMAKAAPSPRSTSPSRRLSLGPQPIPSTYRWLPVNGLHGFSHPPAPVWQTHRHWRVARL